MWGRPDVIDYTGEIRVGDEVEIRAYRQGCLTYAWYLNYPFRITNQG